MIKVKRPKKWRRTPGRRAGYVVLAAGLVGLMLFVGWLLNSDGSPAANRSEEPSFTQPVTEKSPAAFDKKQFSLTESGSPWVVVNKGRQLPSGYRPADLTVPNVALRYASGGTEMQVRAEAAAALQKMFAAASNEGIRLMLASGFRSHGTQASVYQRHVDTLGRGQADRESARAGHSEHQTGWAADVEPASRACELEQCFGDTPEGRWVADNAHRFGFIIRYQNGNEALTGYFYEPWHLRYVGEELSREIHAKNQTLEQFFGLPAHPVYPAVPLELE